MRTNANAANLPCMFSFSDVIAVLSGGLKANYVVQTSYLGLKVFKMEQVCNTADSGSFLGSHSTIRKYAPTHARMCAIF